MIRINRVYTKTGDQGNTSLGNGQRISKNSADMQAIGDVDELNAFIGVIAAEVSDEKIQKLFLRIQNDLFDCGADICQPEHGKLRIISEQVDFLEKQIDEYNKELAPLNSFVLPAGKWALVHFARTVARRAERSVVGLGELREVNPILLKYLNRLSDLLFVLARYLNTGQEIFWIPGNNR